MSHLFRRRCLLALTALLVFAATQRAAAQLPEKPLKPPLPSEKSAVPAAGSAAPGEKPTPPPPESVEQKRLKSTPDPRRNEAEILPPPAGADETTATYKGSVAAVDVKDQEVQVKFGEEEFFAFVVDDKTEIAIDSEPASLEDVKTDDPIIVTTAKDVIGEKLLALKLEVVRVKRTAVPSDPPIVTRPPVEPLHTLDIAVALGAICVPTPEDSVLVVAVDRDSPADRVGIRSGDFILEINGQKPQDILLRGDLVYFLKEPKAGMDCAVVVWRAGKAYSAQLMVVEVDVAPKSMPLVDGVDVASGEVVGGGTVVGGGAVVGGGVVGGGVVGGEVVGDEDLFLNLERRIQGLDVDDASRGVIQELLTEAHRLRGQLGYGTQPEPGTQPAPGTQTEVTPKGARYQTQPGVPPKGARYQTQPGTPPKGARYQTQPSAPSGNGAGGTQPR